MRAPASHAQGGLVTTQHEPGAITAGKWLGQLA